MKIQTFPLQFTEDELNTIRETAKEQGKSIKQFMMDAIREALKKEDIKK